MNDYETIMPNVDPPSLAAILKSLRDLRTLYDEGFIDVATFEKGRNQLKKALGYE